MALLDRRRLARFLAGMLVTVVVIFPGASRAQDEHPSGLRAGPGHLSIVGIRDVGPGAANATTDSYIIRFNDPPLARYRGDLAATQPTIHGSRRLDVTSEASRAYLDYLEQQQSRTVLAVENSLGRTLDVTHRYRFAFNGFAARLTPIEAGKVAQVPGVVAVTHEKVRFLTTDAGPNWIGAPEIWGGTATGGLPGTSGEGVVVGVIDSGINPNHPSFADVGGDGYDHTNPRPKFYGVCDPADPGYDPSFVCNDKLIGAWNYADGPSDSRGHGSHAASTAVGNVLFSVPFVAPTVTLFFDISGVAPHANVVSYDACDEHGSCPEAGLLDAIDQAVADMVDVINYPVAGWGADPWTDAESIALLAAHDAGIFVAASAGNSGPHADTVRSPANAPWVTAVGAATHDRHLLNALAGMGGGDTTPPPDILGKSVSANRGPATIVYAGDFGDEFCGYSFDPGTWTQHEIVVCEYEFLYLRTDLGENVLNGGAGGLVLANQTNQGEFVVADSDVLPTSSIGVTDANALKTWLSSGANHFGWILGSVAEIDPSEADVLARFSSRGPFSALPDVLKPDITAPGVDIVAANGTGSAPQILGGTSVASAHVAGAAALLRALHPGWTPSEIKSALLTTANPEVIDGDGTSPTDHFDRGAGRVDLWNAGEAGLIMDETGSAFAAADPAVGGDPTQLNLPSLAEDACIGFCRWSRSFTNPLSVPTTWVAKNRSDSPNTMGISISPYILSLAPGATGILQIEANTSLAGQSDWLFGEVELTEVSAAAPDARLPLAVQGALHTDASLLSKNVDKSSATSSEILTYEIQLENWTDFTSFSLADPIPDNSSWVPGSASALLDGNPVSFTYEPATDSMVLSCSLIPAMVNLSVEPSPFGYVSLDSFYPDLGCPVDCDDGGWLISGLDFYYAGQHHDSALFSVNGTLEAGTGSGLFASPLNDVTPSPTIPNNLLAPFWTDLDLSSTGEMYVGVLIHDQSARSWDVFEWKEVPEAGYPSSSHSFQIWIERGSDNIHLIYGQISPSLPASLTVGVENRSGTDGESYYYNGAGTEPAVGVDLLVDTNIGSVGTFSFQVEVEDESVPVVNIAEATLGTRVLKSSAVTVVNVNCLPPWDRILAGYTIDGSEQHGACRDLTVINSEVTGTGDAGFCTGRQVAIGNGFSVASGGRLTIGTDETLDCSF